MATSPIVRPLGCGRPDLLALAARHPKRYPALLESAAAGTPQGRFDILFAFPDASLQLDADGRVRDENGACIEADGFLDALDQAWRRQADADTSADVGLPFHGGWLLYLGYELAAEIEPGLRAHLPSDERLPVALALRCPVALIHDHREGTRHLVALPGHAHRFDEVLADLAATQALTQPSIRIAAQLEDDPCHFLDGVARSIEYLHAGDVFQVNLSRQWQLELAEGIAPASLHAALRQANPAPFAALLQWRDWAIASSSPERLVERRGHLVQTRPIAGTRPRLAGEDEAARIRELIGHPKERAEHIMLIDLERNDLGRVCEPGSVEVDELMSIESYAHVHHIVSNVRGRLRPGVTPGQIVRAVFPGGTITGCPKVRCMQIIAELEGTARGPYTGAIGYLDRNGDLDLNILIRTLHMQGRSLRFRAGAGIVADSDVQAELAETRAKARGLMRALGLDA